MTVTVITKTKSFVSTRNKAEKPEIKEENLDTEEAPLELSEEAPAEENKPE